MNSLGKFGEKFGDFIIAEDFSDKSLSKSKRPGIELSTRVSSNSDYTASPTAAANHQIWTHYNHQIVRAYKIYSIYIGLGLLLGIAGEAGYDGILTGVRTKYTS